MTIETSLLKHLRNWKYEGSSTTYQYSNAYEYIKDIRVNAVRVDLDFISKLHHDMSTLNGQNFSAVTNNRVRLEKILKLLSICIKYAMIVMK